MHLINTEMFSEFREILYHKPNDHDRNETDRHRLVKALGTIKFFSDKSVQQEMFLRECQKHFKLEKFVPGETIFRQHDKGDKLYLVLEGMVDILRPVQRQSLPAESQSPRLRNQLKHQATYNARTSVQPTQIQEVHPYVKFINVDSDAQIIEYMETIKTCHPGECFGEVALTMNKPRFGTATVPLHLIEPCYLASLDKTAYETTFLNSNNELDQKMKAIERVFPNVPSNVLIRLSYNFQPKEYQHNEIVYQEGQLPDCFHMIVLGEVSIEAYQKPKIKPERTGLQRLIKQKQVRTRPHRLSVMTEGGIFGLEEIIAQTPRITSARCISQRLLTYALPQESYYQYLKTESTSGIVRDIEMAAQAKREFYQRQIREISQHVRLRNDIVQQGEQRGLRAKIEDEHELEELFTKLSNTEQNRIRSKLEENSLDSALLRQSSTRQKEGFSYRLEDFEKKKRLISFFVNTRRVTKRNQKQDESQYFEYREMFSQQSLLKAKTHKMLSINNPFFGTTSHSPRSPPKAVENKPSYDRFIKQLREQVKNQSNVDHNIISIKKLYELQAQSITRTNLGLMEKPDRYDSQSSAMHLMSKDVDGKVKRLLETQSLKSLHSNTQDSDPQPSIIETVNSPPQNNKIFIRSKHHLFRVKPERDFIKEQAYATSSKTSERSFDAYLVKNSTR